jgi:hypothetical protein
MPPGFRFLFLSDIIDEMGTMILSSTGDGRD